MVPAHDVVAVGRDDEGDRADSRCPRSVGRPGEGLSARIRPGRGPGYASLGQSGASVRGRGLCQTNGGTVLGPSRRWPPTKVILPASPTGVVPHAPADRLGEGVARGRSASGARRRVRLPPGTVSPARDPGRARVSMATKRSHEHAPCGGGSRAPERWPIRSAHGRRPDSRRGGRPSAPAFAPAFAPARRPVSAIDRSMAGHPRAYGRDRRARRGGTARGSAAGGSGGAAGRGPGGAQGTAGRPGAGDGASPTRRAPRSSAGSGRAK